MASAKDTPSNGTSTSKQSSEQSSSLIEEENEKKKKAAVVGTQAAFDEEHPPEYGERFDRVYSNCLDVVDIPRDKIECSGKCGKAVFFYLVPLIDHLRTYSLKSDLVRDVLAGVLVGVLNIPQGLGFALVAGLPPVYGLYTSLFPVAIYCFFTNSRHNAQGSFALISIMVREAITRLSESPAYQTMVPVGVSGTANGNDSFVGNITTPSFQKIYQISGVQMSQTEFLVAAAISLCFLVGIIQLAAGALRLGFLVSFMSQPMLSGFTTAACIQMMLILVPEVFGFSVAYQSRPGGNALVF